MTIDLLEPRDGTLRIPLQSNEAGVPVVASGEQKITTPRTETYYLIVEFPHLIHEDPDADEGVTLDDLRAHARRHAATEESADPLPGWPDGWQ